jgi:hypothetical protein
MLLAGMRLAEPPLQRLRNAAGAGMASTSPAFD